jgi:hypothetical protein
MQYSVAHWAWHVPPDPQSHDAMSLTRLVMPAVCACWQHVMQALPVDIAAHIWSVGPASAPPLLLLPDVLPLPEPLELTAVPPLPLLPELLPLVLPAAVPLELPDVLPEPVLLPGRTMPPALLPLLPLLVVVLLGLVVVPEQPLA